MTEACTPVQNLIALYVEGKLSREEEGVVLEHVRGCKDCQQDITTSRFLADLLKRGFDLPAPPADFAQGVLKSMKER